MSSPPRSYLNDGEHYDACHAHRLDDVPFWTQAASSCRTVLELGCGTGRIATPIAASGRRVVGVDSNQSMLDQAQRKARAAGVDIQYVLGDMRSFDLGRDDLDLAILAFNTVNLLLTLDDALACLRCARRHLSPTGRLIIDTFLPTPARLVGEELQSEYVLPDDVKIAITAHRSYDPAQQLRTLDLVIRSSNGAIAHRSVRGPRLLPVGAGPPADAGRLRRRGGLRRLRPAAARRALAPADPRRLAAGVGGRTRPGRTRRRRTPQRVSGLYLIRCGWSASVPRRRLRSAS